MECSLATLPGTTSFTLLCRGAAEAAGEALQRADGEALHDLRVALRRLRAVVGCYGTEGPVQRRMLRRLKRLTRLTNRARDGEVMLLWLEGQWPHLDVGEQDGAVQWRERLQEVVESSKGLVQNRQVRGLLKLLPTLSASDAVASGGLGAAAAACLQDASAALFALLESSGPAEQLHAVRLQSKRLRYLLLPFREELPACRDAEALLQQLQQLLGEWHDSVLCQQSLREMLCDEIGSLHGAVARALGRGRSLAVDARRPAMRGLLTLARRNQQRQQQLLAEIRHYREGGAVKALDSRLRQAVAALQREGAG